MIAIVLGVLFTLALVSGTGTPASANALRAGREHFLAIVADRAARGALAEWFETRWADSTAGPPPPGPIGFGTVATGGATVDRTLHHLGGDLWLLDVRAATVDAAGRLRAGSRLGWLVRAGVFPADSVPVGWLISRSSVRGFQ